MGQQSVASILTKAFFDNSERRETDKKEERMKIKPALQSGASIFWWLFAAVAIGGVVMVGFLHLLGG